VDGKQSIIHESAYLLVWSDKRSGGDRYVNLR